MADYFESGFCVRERSWHGKETLLTEDEGRALTIPEARRIAGIEWEPELRPLYFLDDDGNLVEEQGARRVIRNDLPAAEAGLGTVSGTFELITNTEMCSIIEPLLEQPGVRLDTMGSVKGGRQVYATVLLDEPYQVTGDVDAFGDPVLTLPYFAVLNSHDGSGACKGLYTQVRVVCANTVQAAAADGDRHGAQFSLRHTSGVKARIDEARDVIEGARVEAARWREMAHALSLIPFSDDQQMQFLSEFIPEPPQGITSERVRANIDRDRKMFLHVLRESSTNQAIQHTGLGVVCAAIEYLDHVRGYRSTDTYMGRQILSAEPLKAKAISLVRDLAGASS